MTVRLKVDIGNNWGILNMTPCAVMFNIANNWGHYKHDTMCCRVQHSKQLQVF